MLVIKDFATTILASALTAAATSVVVSDASRLPALSAGDYYYLVLQKFTDRTNVEVVKVTGAVGNTLTVVRAQAGTTAKSFAIGDYAEQRVTVGTFSEYIAQSVAGKVDKSDGYVEQSLGLLNTADSVRSGVGVVYDATNGHGTVLSGGEGANKLTPHVLLRPLGMADASVQAKYGADGSLILTGGSRYVETGLLSMKHPSDANGWPNATDNNANNYNNRARGKIHVNNNALYFIADGALNARRFGIQSGHEHPGYATSYGALDLNPFGGTVRVNGGTVYHTNYVPTPAVVGALALSGGTITGDLDQNISGYGTRFTVAGGVAFLQGGKVGGDTADQKLMISGILGNPLTEFDILTAGHGVAKANGARIYTEQYVPTPDVLGVVPQARTINSKPLTSNITLSAADVGALPVQAAGGVLEVGKYIDFYDAGANVDYSLRLMQYGTALRVQGYNGYVDVGAQNTSYAHYYTDRPEHYFDKNVNVNDLYVRSDVRLKSNLEPLSDALAKVCSLKGWTYDKKLALDSEAVYRRETGLIAQDVQKVLPSAVHAVEGGLLTLSSSALVALLVEAVKELSEKVKELEHGRT